MRTKNQFIVEKAFAQGNTESYSERRVWHVIDSTDGYIFDTLDTKRDAIAFAKTLNEKVNQK